MPFYEYECSACKFYVETLQKISDPPLAKCPSCGKDAMQRLISAPVFRLKGAGWYETDFKSDKENKRNLADDKEPASSTDSDDKKVKVRASKALTKALKSPAARKSANKASKKRGQKAVKKAGKKQVAGAPVVKAARKTAKPSAGKKVTRKVASKAAKKSVGKPASKSAKKVARKKTPARKK